MTEPAPPPSCLVLRLAGPLQSWGRDSRFNHRETAAQPTKSAVVGLLAAAQGRRHQDSLEDLVGLHVGVRVDQPGTVMRDFHTAADLTGAPLLSTNVNTSGRQKPTSPAKTTAVTMRYYLQDAVFVAVLAGPHELLGGLAEALAAPAFQLWLGRKSCPPTQPLLLPVPGAVVTPLWPGTLTEVLERVPWQASPATAARSRRGVGPTVPLTATVDDPHGDDLLTDRPVTFAPQARAWTTRRVRQLWVHAPNPFHDPVAHEPAATHDPFALLGW